VKSGCKYKYASSWKNRAPSLGVAQPMSPAGFRDAGNLGLAVLPVECVRERHPDDVRLLEVIGHFDEPKLCAAFICASGPTIGTDRTFGHKLSASAARLSSLHIYIQRVGRPVGR
jgi:hypothetical protein